MFHSTKIWEFLFHCPACPQKIVCKTDPENCDYLFISGADKFVNLIKIQMNNEKAETDVIILDSAKMAVSDPFAILENEIEDKKKSDLEKPRLR